MGENMTKKLFEVTIPIAGYITCKLDADNKEEAIEKALEKNWLKRIELEDDFECQDINTYEKIIEGNICYIDIYEVEAEEIDN
jgi:hypothetical protein